MRRYRPQAVSRCQSLLGLSTAVCGGEPQENGRPQAPQCLYRTGNAEDVHQPFEVVGQHMQAHFRADSGQRSGQEVCRAHPMFERAKRVLHGLSAHAHHLWFAIKPLLHGFQDCFVPPTLESTVTARGAAAAYRAARAGRTLVSIQLEAIFHRREALDCTLSSRTLVLIISGYVDEVLLTKTPFRLAAGGHRLGHEGGNARLLARQDFHPAEVASVGNDAKAFRSGGFASLLGHRGERCTVMADVGDFVRNDQVMPGIDRRLHVVADYAGALPELSRRASHRSRGGPWSTGCWPKFMARMVLDLVGRIGHGVAI
ncbi:hypothetical protein PALA37_02515 [Pseudomonas aeruginosa]|nr:hypothetical protein IHMA87_05801 [Pseudomonas aeruginosa]WBI86860.1 hypothetical protein PALA37_02515 [Pseudomonas aeruginosa]